MVSSAKSCRNGVQLLIPDGALIQGAWGNSKISAGQLSCASYTGSEELTRSNLDFSLRGYVILAGYVSQADALLAADEMPLRGLILGSMAAEPIPTAMQVQFPILLIEGFGRTPINSHALNPAKKPRSARKKLLINAYGDAFQRKPRPKISFPSPAKANWAIRIITNSVKARLFVSTFPLTPVKLGR